MAQSKGRLPPLVERYLQAALPAGRPAPQRMRLRQVGELRLKPGARWLRFHAEHVASVSDLGFVWRARVAVLPFLDLEVVDRLDGGEARGEIRVLGLRVGHESGPRVAQGATLRYLAELPWVPYAMMENKRLDWREVDDRSVEVAADEASREALRLEFDADGTITRAWTDARPRKEGKDFVARPWGGVYSDYDMVGGVVVPARAEVTWELPEGPFTWFRATIAQLEA